MKFAARKSLDKSWQRLWKQKKQAPKRGSELAVKEFLDYRTKGGGWMGVVKMGFEMDGAVCEKKN